MDVAEVTTTYQAADEIRLFFVFSGTVQGVGFRWTTQDLAQKAQVSGWVRNMEDGTVQAEMQGQGAAICSVLSGLERQFEHARSHYTLLRHMNLHFSIDTCKQLSVQGCSDNPCFEVLF